jgi:hypothetical protein
MRLYRGLKEPYRPEKVVPRSGQPFVGTDFTNCPLMALRYACARRGVVLVLDVPAATLDSLKFTEELWSEMRGAKRFMAWGKFDEFITAILPAKELRSLIRMKGVASSGDEYKDALLKRKIQERLDEVSREARSGSATSAPTSGAGHGQA